MQPLVQMRQQRLKGPEPILALLATADVNAGIKTAKKCTACHVFDKGGKNKVGPGLWNIVNARIRARWMAMPILRLWPRWKALGLSGVEWHFIQAKSLSGWYQDEFRWPEKASGQSKCDCLFALSGRCACVHCLLMQISLLRLARSRNERRCKHSCRGGEITGRTAGRFSTSYYKIFPSRCRCPAKADDSPVTIADKSVEAALRHTIDTLSRPCNYR